MAPTITVLSEGKEQREPLRYRPAIGAKRRIAFTTGGSYKLKVGDREAPHAWPSLKIELEAVAAEVRPDGTAAWKLSVVSADALGPDGRPAKLDVATSQTLEALPGVAGRLVVDSRGLPQELVLHPGPKDRFGGTNRQIELRTYYATELLKQLLAQLVPPFPEQPVGVGARWRADRPATRGMVNVTQSTTYELLTRDKGTLKLGLVLGGGPGFMPGLKPHQMQVELTGRGEAVVDLAGLGSTRHDEQCRLDAKLGEGPGLSHHAGDFTFRLDARPKVESK